MIISVIVLANMFLLSEFPLILFLSVLQGFLLGVEFYITFIKQIMCLLDYFIGFTSFQKKSRQREKAHHITTGSWKGRGNQYIQFVRVLYCKLPTNGKQLPAFPLEAVPGIEPRPQRWEARVLPQCYHRGPSNMSIV